MGSSLVREGVESRKINRLGEKNKSGNRGLAVSRKLKSNGVKITAKGNYRQKVVCLQVNRGDQAVLSEHMILAVGSLSA